MMAIIAFILLIISLSKILLLVYFNNQLEVRELIYNTPILANTLPELLTAIITADGLVGLICSLFLLTVAL